MLEQGRKKAALLLAAMCAAAVFAACGVTAPVGQSGAEPQADEALPEDAGSAQGVVLDASDGQFILRTVEGAEYVFRLDGAQDTVDGGAQAGDFVRVWYDGELTGTNARNVTLLRIEPAQETQAEPLTQESFADGYVTEFDDQNITICTRSGKEYTFTAGAQVRSLQTELKTGLWVRISFDGSPDHAVVRLVTERAAAPDAFTLVGRVRSVDEDEQTLTLKADTGKQYTFSTQDAQIDVPDGLRAGSRVQICYTGSAVPDDTSHAQLLRVQAEKLAPVQSVCGTVCAVNTSKGNVDLCTADGRVLTFYTGRSITGQDGGVAQGDAVRVVYTGCIGESSTRYAQLVSLEVTSRGESGETGVTGTVRTVDDDTLTLEAADGRTLTFALPHMEQESDIGRGDTVQVTYTGWITGEDTANAVFVSVSRAYL